MSKYGTGRILGGVIKPKGHENLMCLRNIFTGKCKNTIHNMTHTNSSLVCRIQYKYS